jgi:hypothetical protein
LDEASKLLDDTTVLSKTEATSGQGAGMLTGAPELGADQGFGSIQTVLPFDSGSTVKIELSEAEKREFVLDQTTSSESTVVNTDTVKTITPEVVKPQSLDEWAEKTREKS